MNHYKIRTIALYTAVLLAFLWGLTLYDRHQPLGQLKALLKVIAFDDPPLALLLDEGAPPLLRRGEKRGANPASTKISGPAAPKENTHLESL